MTHTTTVTTPRAASPRGTKSRVLVVGPIVVLVVAACALAGAISWRMARSEPASPSASSVDVGFFHDMTVHHEQAIAMASDYQRRGDHPRLLQVTREIITNQSNEIGVMNEYLTEWGRTGDRPDRAMGWMHRAITYGEMPGMATEAQLDELAGTNGPDLDRLLTELMINHHAGGVHMAAHAAEHGGEASTRRWAAAMRDGQRREISEMNQWRAGLLLPPIFPEISALGYPAPPVPTRYSPTRDA